MGSSMMIVPLGGFIEQSSFQPGGREGRDLKLMSFFGPHAKMLRKNESYVSHDSDYLLYVEASSFPNIIGVVMNCPSPEGVSVGLVGQLLP